MLEKYQCVLRANVPVHAWIKGLTHWATPNASDTALTNKKPYAVFNYRLYWSLYKKEMLKVGQMLGQNKVKITYFLWALKEQHNVKVKPSIRWPDLLLVTVLMMKANTSYIAVVGNTFTLILNTQNTYQGNVLTNFLFTWFIFVLKCILLLLLKSSLKSLYGIMRWIE